MTVAILVTKTFVRHKPTFLKTYILTETSFILAHILPNVGFPRGHTSFHKPAFLKHSENVLGNTPIAIEQYIAAPLEICYPVSVQVLMGLFASNSDDIPS